MERFSNGAILKWSNSQMEQFSNGAIWGRHPMPYFKIPRTEKYGMRCANSSHHWGSGAYWRIELLWIVLSTCTQRIGRIVNDGCSYWQTRRMRASLGPPGTWQSRYSFRVRVPWGPGSPMREGVTRMMQTDLGGFTTLGNDNNIYICSIAPSG